MLNPSTADATKNDPTIRRCIGFAAREGCTELTVVNLFALRATNPKELNKHPDPVGPENNDHIRRQMEKHVSGGLIVAAWGANKNLLTFVRADEIQAEYFGHLMCLGTTADGMPRHPLYVPASTPLELLK